MGTARTTPKLKTRVVPAVPEGTTLPRSLCRHCGVNVEMWDGQRRCENCYALQAERWHWRGPGRPL